jgi:hypothetical protein
MTVSSLTEETGGALTALSASLKTMAMGVANPSSLGCVRRASVVTAPNL